MLLKWWDFSRRQSSIITVITPWEYGWDSMPQHTRILKLKQLNAVQPLLIYLDLCFISCNVLKFFRNSLLQALTDIKWTVSKFLHVFEDCYNKVITRMLNYSPYLTFKILHGYMLLHTPLCTCSMLLNHASLKVSVHGCTGQCSILLAVCDSLTF